MAQARLLQSRHSQKRGEKLNRVSQDPAYSRLKNHLIASTGLAFYADRDALLAELIGGRLADLGLRDCSSYAGFLADGETGRAEMDVLIAQTHHRGNLFFPRRGRNSPPFATLFFRTSWSANRPRSSCESGAPVAPPAPSLIRSRFCWRDEMADRIAGWQIGIHATDLNRSYLAQAAEGKFRAWALALHFRRGEARVLFEGGSQPGPFIPATKSGFRFTK